MKPTVVILTCCIDPSLEYGSTLVFDTIRTGFPTAKVIVVDNGSHLAVRSKIKEKAESVGCLYMQEERHSYLGHYRMLLLDQTEVENLVILDPDVVFWESVEGWTPEWLISGRLIPDLVAGTVTSVERLHPSFLWIPSVSKLRKELSEVRIAGFNPVTQISVPSGNGYHLHDKNTQVSENGYHYYDTMATMYQALKAKCSKFSDDQLSSYDHLFYGSHFPAVAPGLEASNPFELAHKLANEGRVSELRGIWRAQEEYFKVPHGMDSSINAVKAISDSFCQFGASDSEQSAKDLIAGIKEQIRIGATELSKYDDKHVAIKEIAKLPQAHMPVIHHLGPGIAIRELSMPKGTIAVGAYQKYDHMNVLLKGAVMMKDDEGNMKVLSAPMIFTGKPGQKMGYVIEDMIWQNIYATDLTDPEEIEDYFIDRSLSGELQDKRGAYQLIDGTNADREDYLAVLRQFGVTETIARSESENKSTYSPILCGHVRISKSSIEGKGLFVTAPISAGSVIMPARIKNKRTQAGRYTNHSKTPNAKFVLRRNGDIDLVALIDFTGCHGGDHGQEVTIDYRQAIGQSIQQEITA